MTAKHSRRTVGICKEFAEYLGYKKDKVDKIIVGAMVHDTGKYYIPSNLINLPRRLTRDEFEIVKRHPKLGYETISTITDDEVILNMCLHHHERWDGNGYPEGLVGDEIPIEARIMAICDVFEALTSKRNYKNEIEIEDAIGIIRLKAGNHFDPDLVDDFINMHKLKKAGNSLKRVIKNKKDA